MSGPDGLASAALAGVNPVYGLYTSAGAPIGGSLLVSAQLVQVSTTSASALAVGQAIAGWDGVQLVADVSPIPRGLPAPVLPDPGLITVPLLLAAFSLAVIIAVQGAGVSQSVENPDGSRSSPSRDMVAQGVGNLLSGLLRGIPAGGAVGQTALNVSVGARSRWAGVLGGLWMLVFLLLLTDLVGRVPMAVLAALMILAGVGAIDLREARSIWNTGASARWAIGVTFVATLVLSIPLAVAAGVLLTLVLYVASSASDVRVRALVARGDGRFAEGARPRGYPAMPPPCWTSTGACSSRGRGRSERRCPAWTERRDRWWCCACAAAPAWARR